MLTLFLVIVLAIVIHLLGFLIAAKLLCIPVLVFSIFMGPPLFSFTLRKTVVQFCMLPLGGYVKVAQREGGNPSTGSERHFEDLHPLTRVAFFLMGCFLLGVVSFATLGARDAWDGFLHTYSQFLNIAVSPIKFGAAKLEAFFAQVSNGTISPLQALGWVSIKFSALNLLPLPLLNGGAALITLIKWKKTETASWENTAQLLGLFLGSSVFVTFAIALIAALLK
jgi:regulator of sigma E protease